MSEQQTLRSCPFCGSEKLTVWDENTIYHVECMTCFCQGAACDSKDIAIERWNTRADTPSVQSAPDTVRRQEAIRELQAVVDYHAEAPDLRNVSMSLKTAQTALSALKSEGKVQIPYIGEVK